MKLTKLSLYNFRSYTEREFEFDERVTVITGLNGVGKTNLLEAVYVLCMGKSFRDSDEALLNHNTTWWKLCGLVDEEEREIRFQTEPARVKQSFINGAVHKRITYRQQLPVVLFEPDDLLMIHASPRARREFLDDVLLKISPTYRQTLSKYERALLQRNNLLKQQNSLSSLRDTVFVWDIAISEYGSELVRQREQLIYDVNKTLAENYSFIADKKTELEIVYQPKASTNSQNIAKQLYDSLGYDLQRGFTGVGPHRDDLEFVLNGQSAKTTASRGEVRTLVLALKQCENALIEKHTEKTPLLLFDDVFSELDNERQKQNLKGFGDAQVFITATHLPSGLRKNQYGLNIELS